MNLVHPRLRVFAAQCGAFVRAQLLLPRVAIHQKQRVHARDHRDRRAVFRIHFHRIDELAPRMRPAAHVNQTRSAHLVIRLITVGLQNPIPILEEFRGTIAAAAQLKIEYRLAAPALESVPYCHKYA